MIDLVGLLGTLPGPLLLGVVSIMLAAESGMLIGVVLPGSTLLLSLGLLVSLGMVPLAAALITALAATVVGSQLGFLRARHGRSRSSAGGAGPTGSPLSRQLRRTVGNVEPALHRRTARTAGAARLVGGLRTITPRVAGGMEVSYRQFAVGDVIAATIWAPSLVLLGYFAGSAFDQIRTVAALVGPPLLLLILLAWGCCAGWQRLARPKHRRTRFTAAY
ncbi:hypothetical protein BH24ACT9_BH24ACT9_05220 [soil metagenome]